MASGRMDQSHRQIREQKLFIPHFLTDGERAVIRRLLAIEKVWWDRWKNGPTEEHWCMRGEDAFWEEKVEGLDETMVRLAIDMRGYFYETEDGGSEEIGWVPAERIVSWEQGVVPTAINWFMERFFGASLFGYGLYFYYQCATNMLVVGGRGSGKTKQVAMAMAAWCSLHPGQNWIHYGYTLEQAKAAFTNIIELGMERIPQGDQTQETAPLSWTEVFMAVGGIRESPYPRLKFRRWDNYDPGNTIDIRPLNPQLGATRTRSGNCARCSIDECTTDVEDENVLAVAEATVRGPNPWRLKQMSQEERERARVLLTLSAQMERDSWNATDHPNYPRYEAVQAKLDVFGLTRHLGRIRTGNSGPGNWIKRRQVMAGEDPRGQSFYRVAFSENPYLTSEDRKALIATYPDPEQALVELYALEPMGQGNWFAAGKLRQCRNPKLDELNRAKRHEPGYDWQEWMGHVVRWSLPYEAGYKYVLGADPGTGRVPDRDSWNVQVWRFKLDRPLAELVYWQWGNIIKIQGSWAPFMECLDEARRRYRIHRDDCIVGVGGQEAGILEATYGAGQAVSAVSMTGHYKPTLANYARELTGHIYARWPEELRDLTVQLSNWQILDKQLVQDTVMAFFAASFRLYHYFHGFLVAREQEMIEQPATYYENYWAGRRRGYNRRDATRRATLK